MDKIFFGDRNPPNIILVIPCFNEHEGLHATCSKLLEVFVDLIDSNVISPLGRIVFVDDGSTDHTWEIIKSFCGKSKYIKGVKLSRNFGHQNALMAGLMYAKDKCDASISMDADLQQDPTAIKKFINNFINGDDIVFGVRSDRLTDGLFKRITANFFYWLMNIMGVHIIPNHADYRLLSKRAIDTLAEYREPNLFLRAACVDVGFRSSTVEFAVSEREHGKSKYSIAKMIGLAFNGITSFSATPLRLISVIGILIFGLSICMGIYIFLRYLLVGDTVPGWASTTLPIYILGGLHILCLSVIGEYIAQILMGVKDRPTYIVEEVIQ